MSDWRKLIIACGWNNPDACSLTEQRLAELCAEREAKLEVYVALAKRKHQLELEENRRLEQQLAELRDELTTVQNAHSKALANNTALRKWITKLEGK